MVEALLEVDEGLFATDGFADFFAGDEFAGAADEEAEDLGGLGSAADGQAAFAQFPSLEIELVDAEPDGYAGDGFRSRHAHPVCGLTMKR